MSMNLVKTVVGYMKSRPEEKFTARQLAEWVFAAHPVECAAKKAASSSISTDAQLVQQLTAEIGAQRPGLQKRHPEVKTTEGRPRRYYYSTLSDSAEVAAVEHEIGGRDTAFPTEARQPRMTEHALYPMLDLFMREEFGLYCLRIDEKRSSNRRGASGNHWLHPDVVAMEDLGADWARDVRDCVSQCSARRARLWSFEVKLLLNRSNVRESFFQAVSNSSWANFGYLVAAEVVGADTLKELRMLYAAHGIGLIQLDVENPADSQVLIPARERDEVDWDMVNRLATENADYLEYVRLIRQFHQTGEVRRRDWGVREEGERRGQGSHSGLSDDFCR